MKLSRVNYLAVMALLIAAYVALRCWGLTASCLWFDEIFGVHAAEHSWGSILSFVALDLIHPPLFYVLLKLWIGAAGDSLLWLRMFPVLFSVLGLVPFLLLCRELKLGRPATLLALLLFAVNGSLIKYAQEVRMYSLLLCFALFSMWLFARYFYRGKSFLPLLLINILLVYTHYFGWLVVGTEIVLILIFQRIKWRAALTMFAVTFAAFLPWIFAVWHAARSGSDVSQNIGWMHRPGIKAIIGFKLGLIEPFYHALSSADPASVIRVSIPLMLLFATAIVLYAMQWNSIEQDKKRTAVLLAMFASLPVLAALAASWIFPYSIWGTRHLIIVFAPVSILLAIMITTIRHAAANTAIITLVLLFTAYAFVINARRQQPEFIWCAWEGLADEFILAPNYSTQPKHLYVFEDLVAYHFWYALKDMQNYRVSVVKGVEGVAEDPAYFLPRGFADVPTINANQITEHTIWIAFRENQRVDKDPLAAGPMGALEKAGYRREKVDDLELGGQGAYLVRMARTGP